MVPGVAFGDDRYVRMSYATSDELLEKAIYRLGKAVKSLGVAMRGSRAVQKDDRPGSHAPLRARSAAAREPLTYPPPNRFTWTSR